MPIVVLRDEDPAMEWIKQIKQLLQEGVYVKTLRSIEDASLKGLKGSKSTLPVYVIGQIARNVLDSWEGRPLRLNEQKLVEDALRPSMEAVLDNLLRKASQSEIIASLEALVKTWMAIQSALKNMPE